MEEEKAFVSKENLERFATRVGKAIKEAKDVHFIYRNDHSMSVWPINHNLGKVPSVTVIENYTNQQILAEVVVIDIDTIEIRFSKAVNGVAYLN